MRSNTREVADMGCSSNALGAMMGRKPRRYAGGTSNVNTNGSGMQTATGQGGSWTGPTDTPTANAPANTQNTSLRSRLFPSTPPKPQNYAKGEAKVPGRMPAKGTTDVVPAMLTPGEAVVNRGAVRDIGRGRIEEANEKANRAHSNGGRSGSGAPMSGFEAAMHAHADKCHPVGRR